MVQYIGLFLTALFLLLLFFSFTWLHRWWTYYLRDIKVPCELADLVTDGQSHTEHYLIFHHHLIPSFNNELHRVGCVITKEIIINRHFNELCLI